MNNHHLALEFNIIIEKLKEYALSKNAKETLQRLSPYLSEDMCVRKMAETTSARNLLDMVGMPPLPIMDNLDEFIILAGQRYCEFIVPKLMNAKQPLKGLGIGRRLKYLNDNT